MKEYDAAYKNSYGTEASTFGGYAHDGFSLVVEAIKKSGATPDQIRSGIETQKKLIGVSGIFSLSPTDHNGLDLSAFEMVRITKGDWTIAH